MQTYNVNPYIFIISTLHTKVNCLPHLSCSIFLIFYPCILLYTVDAIICIFPCNFISP